MVDFPEALSPSMRTCFEGIERVEETESRMDDHKFSTCSASAGSGADIFEGPRKCDVRVTLAEITHLLTAILSDMLPPHKISETNNTRRIDIFSWSLETIVAPIITASEVDAMQANLGLPLPEMTFGNNSLVIRHIPSGWAYRFDAESALKWVKTGELQSGDGSVKVGYSDAWFKSRSVVVNVE